RLHWKQAEHTVGAAADLGGALLAPGPDRRADVMNGGDAGVLQMVFQAKVEVWRIDADEHVGLPLEQATTQVAAKAQQSRQMAQRFGQARDGECTAVVRADRTGIAHASAANAAEFGGGKALAERFDQSRTQAIARGFAGDQREARR